MFRRIRAALAHRYIRFVHGGNGRYRHARAPERGGEWADQPIPEAHILEGAPVARAVEFGVVGDGGASFGAWDCTAGRFRWYYRCDEIVQIVEGEAFLQIDGQAEHLTAGSVFFFPYGAMAEWHVPEYIRKNYVLRHPARWVKELM